MKKDISKRLNISSLPDDSPVKRGIPKPVDLQEFDPQEHVGYTEELKERLSNMIVPEGKIMVLPFPGIQTAVGGKIIMEYDDPMPKGIVVSSGSDKYEIEDVVGFTYRDFMQMVAIKDRIFLVMAESSVAYKDINPDKMDYHTAGCKINMAKGKR